MESPTGDGRRPPDGQGGDVRKPSLASQYSRVARFRRDTAIRPWNEKMYNAALNAQALQDSVRKRPNEVIVKLCARDCRVRLTVLRSCLFLANLVVLATVLLSFNSWIEIVKMKRAVEDSDEFRINVWLPRDIGPIVAHCITRMDDFFITISCCLLFYYLVFGFSVALVYGGPKDLLCVVLGFPVVLVLALAELLIAIVCLRIRDTLMELDCDLMNGFVGHNLLSTLVDLRNYMDRHAGFMAVLFVLSSAVQLVTISLPFVLHDMPFQRMMNMEVYMIGGPAVSQGTTCRVSGSAGPPAVPVSGWLEGCTEVRTQPTVTKMNPSAAATVMLRLCRPDMREFHRGLIMEKHQQEMLP